MGSAMTALQPSQSCLEQFKADRLDEVLARCDTTVDDHPEQAEPLSDRALVHSLKGNWNLACTDVRKALSLLNSAGDNTTTANTQASPILLHELSVRQTVCKQLRTMDDNG